MDGIKELEIKKLINEIIFLKENLKVIKEISTLIDIEFNKEINNLTKNDSSLKEQWDVSNKGNDDDDDDDDDDDEIILEETTKSEEPKSIIKDEHIKKIYRDIAKKTHPDKIKDEDKNLDYIKATESYHKNDILDLIYYANKLGIEYNHNTLDIDKIKDNLNKLKTEVKMYESSLPYKWYYSGKDDSIIKNYIALKFLTI
jgi:hypothetical protein